MPGSPEKGQLVSELAKDKSFKTEKDEAEDKTEENTNDDVATEEEAEASE